LYSSEKNKNLAITNRSLVSCAHNTSRAFIGIALSCTVCGLFDVE